MSKIALKNLVWKEGDYYVARCLNVEVSSFGKTRKEAEANLDEALELYFEDIKCPEIVEVKNPKIITQSLTYA